MFNQSCAICEAIGKIDQQREFKVYCRFNTDRQYAMNIIVRDREVEGVKLWEAPKSVFNFILTSSQHLKPFNKYDFIVHYAPEERPWRKYRVAARRKESSLGTEEQKKLWLSQMLELTPESLYLPVKDVESEAILEEVKEAVRQKEYWDWYYSPEGQAEIERRHQEKQEKEAAEKKEKAEREKQIEDKREHWRQIIKNGVAAEEFLEESKKDVEEYTAWDYLDDLFGGGREWEELKEMLRQQLKKSRKWWTKESKKKEEKEEDEAKKEIKKKTSKEMKEIVDAIRAKHGIKTEKKAKTEEKLEKS